jgi:hypothetical protein
MSKKYSKNSNIPARATTPELEEENQSSNVVRTPEVRIISNAPTRTPEVRIISNAPTQPVGGVNYIKKRGFIAT